MVRKWRFGLHDLSEEPVIQINSHQQEKADDTDKAPDADQLPGLFFFRDFIAVDRLMIKQREKRADDENDHRRHIHERRKDCSSSQITVVAERHRTISTIL